MRRLIAIGAAALLTAAVAACSSSASSSSGSTASSAKAPSGTLVISDSQGTQWNCSFNPFNPSNLATGVTFGQVYEPLVFVNTLQSGKTTPWLATAWTWSNNNKTLTFTVRNRVKLHDRTPMTAPHGAFTRDSLQTSPALDIN